MSAPVEVWLSQDRLVDEPVRLDSARLAPGASAVLGPVSATLTDPVRLFVALAGEPGLPPGRTHVHRGYQRVEIIAEGEGGYGPPRIVFLQH